jgi:hypothetical protein
MNLLNCTWISRLFIACLLCLTSLNAGAEIRIAILDFELKDLTMIPRTTAEIERTASIRPLLETELKTADYVIINIPLIDQNNANGGVGYLFDHDDIAANLAKQFGAEYVLVGRLHKPSFLFAYLMGHLRGTTSPRVRSPWLAAVAGGWCISVIQSSINFNRKVFYCFNG